MVNLTQKERMLLEDQKSQEEICIKKYNDYSNQAQNPQLKQLCKDIGQKEVEHLNTINSILNGQVPNISSQQSQQQSNQGQQSNQSQQQSNMGSRTMGNTQNNNDAYICNDLLSTEKHVSSTYNTAIFEFRDANIRQVLNHIQKEEQEHGEQIFNFMESHGMYNPQ
ncbi:MAG TPA: spore coat protein [Eubacteriaceae bacterium]|jgi:spore coat protein CotF|nr:spore coat protein [Eubacteriaceae bacterium]